VLTFTLEGVAFPRPAKYLGELWSEMLAERGKQDLKCQLNVVMVVHACNVARKTSAGAAA
jgi:hypothetical protein